MAEEENQADEIKAEAAEAPEAVEGEPVPVKRRSADRLVEMLERGYEVAATVNVRGKDENRTIRIPKKFHDLFKRVYIMKKDGRYCMLTEDEGRV